MLESPGRPLILDATHLVARLSRVRTSGIDKVDLAYARHFAAERLEPVTGEDRGAPNSRPIAGVSHYGLRRPRVHPRRALVELLNRWSGITPDQGFTEAYQWLTASPARFLEPAVGSVIAEPRAPHRSSRRTHQEGLLARLESRSFQLRWLLSPGLGGGMPARAIYLNIAQHLFEQRQYFFWLRRRQDVTPVFFVHDLIPLDWPEYFPPGYQDRFERRWQTIQEFAGAIITSSACVRARVEDEYRRRNRSIVPIHVAPLPPPLGSQEAELAPEMLAVPYFIIVGTIEPRKNHLLLLNTWRRMAEMGAPPKLLIVGKRGWENEQVLDVLDRSRLVRPHVLELSNLGERALARLIKNARALLLPSFAEGYGLPLVEAQVLGTPVIASDIPVFREVGRNSAIYRHPLDGPGWREDILRLAAEPTSSVLAKREQSRDPLSTLTWKQYFDEIGAFLMQLGWAG